MVSSSEGQAEAKKNSHSKVESTEPAEDEMRTFNDAQDEFIILRAFEKKVYSTPKQKPALFEEIASLLNKSSIRGKIATSRNVCDRFHKLVTKWRAKDNKNRASTGVDEIVTEYDEVMAHIAADLDDIEEERSSLRKSNKAKQEAKSKTDQRIPNKRQKRFRSDNLKETGIEGHAGGIECDLGAESDGDDEKPTKKSEIKKGKKRRKMQKDEVDGMLDRWQKWTKLREKKKKRKNVNISEFC